MICPCGEQKRDAASADLPPSLFLPPTWAAICSLPPCPIVDRRACFPSRDFPRLGAAAQRGFP